MVDQLPLIETVITKIKLLLKINNGAGLPMYRVDIPMCIHPQTDHSPKKVHKMVLSLGTRNNIVKCALTIIERNNVLSMQNRKGPLHNVNSAMVSIALTFVDMTLFRATSIHPETRRLY